MTSGTATLVLKILSIKFGGFDQTPWKFLSCTGNTAKSYIHAKLFFKLSGVQPFRENSGLVIRFDHRLIFPFGSLLYSC
jgi:hypothetical protein